MNLSSPLTVPYIRRTREESLYGTVNGKLKFIQNRSKTAFEVKGRLYTTGKVIQRLFMIYIISYISGEEIA